MKYFYIVYAIEQDDKMMAGVKRLSENDNIVTASKAWKFANICQTKKRAEEIEEAWNQGFVDNGTHLFIERKNNHDTSRF